MIYQEKEHRNSGYRKAPAYYNGKIINEYGGGICQVSSTLYNAVILSNIQVIERKSHSYVPSYVPISRDATVSWGVIDFKFKNNKKNPIKIKAEAINGKLRVDILGTKEDLEYKIESDIVSKIRYKIEYEIEESNNTNIKQTIQNGENGYIGETYRITKKDGKIICKTLISKDIYIPKNKIIKIGK